MVPRKHRYRPLINDYRTAGSVLAEMPVALWILFVGIGLPLIVAITIALRYGLFWQAARQAAQSCCQAQTFYAPPTATAVSAVQAAIPGLTQGCPATVAEERVFEHASGLSE